MKSEELIQLLKDNPELNLRFDYAPGLSVRSDFHITELKNTHVRSVDCGGKTNEWKELIIQLWEPPTQGEGTLSTTKASSIIDKVEKSLALYRDVEVKFEYSNSTERLSIYAVASTTVENGTLVIRLGGQHSECKGLSSGACGTPKEKRALSSVGAEDAACCAPGSSCC